MATTKLIIRKNKINSAGQCLIYVQYCYDGKTILFSTGKKIEPNFWNDKKGEAKDVEGFKGAKKFNSVIKEEKNKIDDILNKALYEKQEPTLEYIKEQYGLLDKPALPEVNKDFFKLYDSFIEESKGIRAYNTLRQHRTAYNTLKEFEKACKYKITLDSIDMKFHSKFVSWLTNEKGHNPNHIGNTIKNLKIFLGDLTDKKINTNLDFRNGNFKKPSAPVETFALTQAELDTLFTFDLSKHPRLDKVRDLFVLGCTTGLRFSDMANLKLENIKEDYLDITTVKTRDKLEVPINAYARQILNNKYQGILPRAMSNQKMNDYLKEVGEKAGITEPVQRVTYNGSKRIEIAVPKYELITTHAARRTFVTLSLEGGMNHKEIMAITGHKSIKTMLKYQNVTKKAAKMAMLRAWGNAPAIMKVS